MEPQQEDTIRARAYQLWEQEGRPEGRHAEHWATAERESRQDGDEAGAPSDDLETDPGIGYSAGTSTQEIDEIKGENTLEGDVMNDTEADGSVSPIRRGRTNK